MSAPKSISVDKHARIIGTPRAPVLLDVRADIDFAADPRLVPGAIRSEAAGLLAVSLGLSRMYVDDLEQLEAGMLIYDALYRWAHDATGETHDWPMNKPRLD